MSSSKTESESPPAKRSLVIEPSSIVPITRQQHHLTFEIQEKTFYHQWTIENFSYYCLSEIGVNKYPYFFSSKFSHPSNSKLQFRLKLFPKGDSEDCKDYLSLFLQHENQKEIVLKYKFWIMNSDGKTDNLLEKRRKFKPGQRWGYSKFCPHEYILNSTFKLLPGEALTIVCEICYDDAVDACDVDRIALNQLEKDCLELSQNKELCDVVLVFGNGKDKEELAVHSAILCARSCVFAAMFEHDMKEKNKRRVDITDVDGEVGEVLVKYLYCDTPCLEIYAERLLPIADKYQLHSLKSICEGALCFKINPESVGNLLLLADMHQATMLKSKCIDYIHCHASCVVECESIQGLEDIMHSRSELYYQLLEQIPQASCNTWLPPSITCDPYTVNWSYTSSSVSKCSQVMTIWQFNVNHLSVSQDYLDTNPHDFIETSAFSSSNSNDNSSVQFSVKLYPHGQNYDCTEHLSLQLQLKCDDKMKVAVKVKASIMVRQNSAKGYTQEIGKKLSNGESIGWPKFISHEQLMENQDLLFNGNDQFVLLFEVFYISNIEPVTKSDVNTFANEHKFSIARDLSQFYSTQKLTDIVFVLGNKTFPVHKSIVSARSSVFAQMFKNKSRAQIKDVEDVESFSRVLALVYGQTEPLTHSAHKMLPLLDKFKLYSLRRVCEIALCSQLSDTNVVDFLLLADKHKATMLKAKAFEYIRRKHSVLTQNGSFKVIQQQSPKLFHELLCYKLDNWRDPTDE